MSDKPLQLARVGDRRHFVDGAEPKPGRPTVAACGTIWIPRTPALDITTDEGDNAYPLCAACAKIKLPVLEAMLENRMAEARSIERRADEVHAALEEMGL